MKYIKESRSAAETAALAGQISGAASAGSIFCLDGDLGAGKTVFAQGFARGLGIEGPVSSPTFTILHIYNSGRLPLYHFDVYRLASPEEMYDLGYEDYFFGDGISIVEWGSSMRALFPEETVFIEIEKDLVKGDDYRRITISCEHPLKALERIL